MRLRLVKQPFDHPDYIFELKHDGFRAITYIQNGGCKMLSRNLRPFYRFKSLRANLARLVGDAIIDGEIVYLDHHGVSRFNELLSTKHTNEVVLYAFDLLWLNGVDLRQQPLLERKKKLKLLVQDTGLRIMFAHHVQEHGKDAFEAICKLDLEGIVAKRKLSIYKDDHNGWIKIKNPKYTQAEGRQELLTRKRS